MISDNVMKTDEFPGAVYYRVACLCGEPECDLTLEIEHDDDFDDISLHMYQDLSWDVYGNNKNWLSRLYKRFAAALKIIFIGRIEVGGELLMRDGTHIESFIGALQEGIEKISKNSYANKTIDDKIDNKLVVNELHEVIQILDEEIKQ